jgi:hypothetical protein
MSFWLRNRNEHPRARRVRWLGRSARALTLLANALWTFLSPRSTPREKGQGKILLLGRVPFRLINVPVAHHLVDAPTVQAAGDAADVFRTCSLH